MTPPAPAPRRPFALRATAALAAVLTPATLLAAGTGSSATAAPAPQDGVNAPFVSRPIAPDDVRRSYSGRRPRPSALYEAACGTPVVAAHPGVARVRSTRWAGPRQVSVATQGGISTVYGYLRSADVEHGQIIQAGQQIGTVGNEGSAERCSMRMRVLVRGKRVNPGRWLGDHLGKPVPATGLYGDPGFMLASFNILGASHTAPGGTKASWPNYDTRLPKAIAKLERHGAEVVGLQEFQRKQKNLFQKRTDGEWAFHPRGPKADLENSIMWKADRFRALERRTFPVPYFGGRERRMPYVLLEDRRTGRTAYVVNVHNPATTKRWRGSAKWRVEAIRRERELVIDLRASGRPVFLTGDMNDREKAFCPLTEGKLMITPNSIPSYDCAMPRYFWVDWIFAAGQARFTSLTVDTSLRRQRISDHPIVIARAHLQN